MPRILGAGDKGPLDRGASRGDVRVWLGREHWEVEVDTGTSILTRYAKCLQQIASTVHGVNGDVIPSLCVADGKIGDGSFPKRSDSN